LLLLPKLKIRRPLLKEKENTEVDVLLSYYNQDGVHSAVNGGIGSEKLSDIAQTL
jgi:hypothetical protein